MGKKVNRAIVLMMAISLLLGSVTAYAAENQEPAIEEVELQDRMRHLDANWLM